MFEVQWKYNGEKVAVYGVMDDGKKTCFLVYDPDGRIDHQWVWRWAECFEPLGTK